VVCYLEECLCSVCIEWPILFLHLHRKIDYHVSVTSVVAVLLSGAKPPQRVSFVETLTKILCDHIPDFWRLGQSYLSGKLLKEVSKIAHSFAFCTAGIWLLKSTSDLRYRQHSHNFRRVLSNGITCINPWKKVNLSQVSFRKEKWKRCVSKDHSRGFSLTS